MSPAATTFADKIDMQNRLFAELSRMFGKEVPLYDKSLLVNKACNQVVCELLGHLHVGFSMSDAQLDKTSGERHGAIRIGRPDEYRWVARFFAAFALEPHNYYDMSDVGSKSQPIVATAFRSMVGPEHRVFCSLLMTDYFDPTTKERIEALLATRQVFSTRAKELIEKGERQAGLDWTDADALIREGADRIFKWTGKARDHQLYKDLCGAGFKIAADIACFESHHLNHLTPNTFCMDLYTSAMKFCLGELTEEAFRERGRVALERLASSADKQYMRLQFKHLTPAEIDALRTASLPPEALRSLLADLVDTLVTRLQSSALSLTGHAHSGFKDFTEGPSEDTPVLLRQDAYKALTEPVVFTEADGSVVTTSHTARFGEIEQRFYATTPRGREIYDRALSEADAEKDKDPGLIKRDFAAYERAYAKPFTAFPKSLAELVEEKLVYARYAPTEKGLAAAAHGPVEVTDLRELIARGFVQFEGLRYEDFLPVSAAGIFASNLNQYGTKSTAAVKPVYTQAMLESVLGKPIVDSDAAYRALEAVSMRETFQALRIWDRISPAARKEIERSIAASPATAGKGAVPERAAASAHQPLRR